MPAYKPLKLVGSCSASARRRAPSKWFAHRRLQNPGRPSNPSRHWRGNVSVEQRAEAGFNNMIMPPSILSGAVFCTHASFRTATAVPVHVKAAAYVLVRVSPSNVRCSPSFGSGSRRAACRSAPVEYWKASLTHSRRGCASSGKCWRHARMRAYTLACSCAASAWKVADRRPRPP